MLRASEEFLENELSQASRVVANDAVFFEEIIEHDAIAELLKIGDIDRDGLGALRAVAPGDFRGDRLAIGDDPIDDATGSVALNGGEMVRKGVAGRFAGLGHEIRDVDAGRFGFGDGVGDFRDEQVRKNTGVERTRAKEDQVGLLNGLDRFRERANVAGQQREFFDWLSAGGDSRLALNFAAVFERGHESDVGERRRKDTTANREDFAGYANGLGEIACDMGERGEEEVAEIMADEAAAGVKAILKEAPQQGLVLRQRDHAVANISGRKNAIFPAKTAGAASVIGDRDDSGEIAHRPLVVGGIVTTPGHIFLKAAQ